jgi:GNAT superfamily N-acetyltransferase
MSEPPLQRSQGMPGLPRIRQRPNWLVCDADPATRPADRRRGVATAILQHAASWATGQGAWRLYLQVEEDNLSALRLYRRLGFQPSHHYHYRVQRPDQVQAAGYRSDA